jgi:opacity protein-like surface antigen
VPDSANSNSKWTRAWALHAGVAYNVTNNVKIELAYRYINFGDIDTPNVACFAFGCGNINGNPNAFYTLTKFDAQELRIGVRFMLTPDVAPAPLYAPPPPVMRKG